MSGASCISRSFGASCRRARCQGAALVHAIMAKAEAAYARSDHPNARPMVAPPKPIATLEKIRRVDLVTYKPSVKVSTRQHAPSCRRARQPPSTPTTSNSAAALGGRTSRPPSRRKVRSLSRQGTHDQLPWHGLPPHPKTRARVFSTPRKAGAMREPCYALLPWGSRRRR